MLTAILAVMHKTFMHKGQLLKNMIKHKGLRGVLNMTVISENGQLKILLPIKEAANWGIAEVLQGQNDQSVKYSLARLLKTAADQVGWDINDMDYIIEIYPQKNKMVQVVFTPDKTKRILPLKASLKRQTKQYVLEFGSSESLLTASKILYLSNHSQGGSLYLFKGNYRLLIKGEQEKVLPLYLELADNVFEGIKEYVITAEYGQEICGQNAIEKLGKALI